MTWSRYVLTVLMVLSPHTVSRDASVAPYYAQGKTLSETQGIGSPTGTDLGQIPGYQDPASVPQAGLTQETIAGETVQKATAHPEATLITDTYENRPRFDLDVRTDPLFTEADKIVENPEKALNVETTTASHSGKITHHTCTKGYDLSQRKCHWRKVPKQVGTRQVEERHRINLSNRSIYQSEQDEKFYGRERREPYGTYHYSQDGSYVIEREREDTCKSLLARGCFQVESQCLEEVGEGRDKHCIRWEQTYTCQENHKLEQTRLKGPALFCLDGDCTDQSWAPNQDMAEALSKLAIFRQMQKEMDVNARTVFKGQSLSCSRTIVNFKDCGRGLFGYTNQRISHRICRNHLSHQ